MIYTVLPVGSYHGWGVCGKYIVKEMSKSTDVRLVTDPFSREQLDDEFAYRRLMELLITNVDYDMIKSGVPVNVDAPILQAINNILWLPNLPNFHGTVNVGYTFFEDNIIPQTHIDSVRRSLDVVVTGSSWCEDVLRNYGLENVTTVIQGIDPAIFNPFFSEKEYFEDQFVVFSGGKFELRKGQDLVIRAYKVLQDRYPDVMLINSWYNGWSQSLQTMSASPHILFRSAGNDYITLISDILRDNGIDSDRVITLPPYPNIMMPRIYKNTDIGLFPNRCEGGTNLVLMEYMACGKPVIASFNSGHKDILTDGNSIPLKKMKPITITNNNVNVAIWDEPDLEEMIANLDWAYQHRERLREKGRQAGNDLNELTWKLTAQRFLELLTV